MLRPALVGPRYFYLFFVDQALPSAEPRTVIFSFLYIPPLDCWPIERPLHGPWNSDWYHFSVICTAVYPPCVVFLSARYSKRCVVPGLKLIFVTCWTSWTCRERTMIGSGFYLPTPRSVVPQKRWTNPLKKGGQSVPAFVRPVSVTTPADLHLRQPGPKLPFDGTPKCQSVRQKNTTWSHNLSVVTYKGVHTCRLSDQMDDPHPQRGEPFSELAGLLIHQINLKFIVDGYWTSCTIHSFQIY